MGAFDLNSRIDRIPSDSCGQDTQTKSAQPRTIHPYIHLDMHVSQMGRCGIRCYLDIVDVYDYISTLAS